MEKNDGWISHYTNTKKVQISEFELDVHLFFLSAILELFLSVLECCKN